jgi:hypothetical protein
MRATDPRLWFIGLTIAAMVGVSYLHAHWVRSDYEGFARQYVREIAHVDAVSARAPSPRLVFAGGSSVVYGIDAGLIERELGVPVINMGMPNSLGSEINYIDYLLPRIRHGDVILYSNTNWWVATAREDDLDATRESRRLADWLWELDGVDLPERHRVDWPLLLPFPDISLIQRLRPRAATAPSAFPWQRDAHGGMVECRPFTTQFKPLDAPSTAPVPEVTARSLQLARDVEARGARLIFFETRILIAPRERDKWESYRRLLLAQLAGSAPLLDASDDSLFSTDASRFCDGASHAGDVARLEWTRFLQSQLAQMPAVTALRGAAGAPANVNARQPSLNARSRRNSAS